MDVRKISQTYSVSPQIAPQDVKTLAGAGFKSIMCNRPDGEDLGQPEYEQIAEQARQVGLEIRWVPIGSSGMNQSDLEAFHAALNEMPAPMLAYCRSGTRCTTLWVITHHGVVPDEEILSATQAAGYDMTGLMFQLQQKRG